MKMRGISFFTQFDARKDIVYCNANQIKQVCLALLVNSSDAVGENGEIYMKTFNPGNKYFQLDISDNGVGIPEDDISHIFQPFYSAKRKTSGIGLGLAIVHGIVESHNGKIEVDSEPGKGTTMSVTFPLAKNNKENE